ETLDRFAEAARQAALADVVVVTKTDLAPFSADLTHRLDMLNPNAPRVVAAAAGDAGALLFAPAGRSAPFASPPSAGAHTHGIDTFALVLVRTPSRLDFARALGGLARRRGFDLLRVKGIVEFADRPGRPAVVQAAQHTIFAPEWLDDWPDDDRRSRLVFVVHDIPPDEILAGFAFSAPSILGSPS
ncbi:MAG TPA: GTP-binding protein, partial [Stellaceae bacterium]